MRLETADSWGWAPCTSILEKLPEELLQKILLSCEPKHLAALETTCKHFSRGLSMDEAARKKLSEIPWAGCLFPQEGETWVTLLQYVISKNTALPQATGISLGSGHSAIILSAGCDNQHRLLATFGHGCNGELGQGSRRSSAMPVCQLEASSVLIASSLEGSKVLNPSLVGCGMGRTAVVTRRGELYMWGLPFQNCLSADGNCICQFTTPAPKVLSNGARIVVISHGANHLLAVSEHHQLLACGNNQYGQLGIGYCRECSRVQPVNLGNQPVASVAAGQAHSLALGFDGTVWAWGLGTGGQLGHDIIARVVKQNQNSQRPIVLQEPKRVASVRPEGLLVQDRVSAIAAGGNHSAFLTLSGDLLCFGDNLHGCLGTGNCVSSFTPVKVELSHLQGCSTAPVRVVQVVCGLHHTLALAQCGGRRLVCSTGLNNHNQLGLGDSLSRTLFAEIQFFRGIDVVAIASGDHHCAAISAAGDLYFWGHGGSGQLGTGAYLDAELPEVFTNGHIVHPSITLGLRA